MTLREAIEQLVNLGENDPRVIADKIRARFDNEWLSGELLNMAGDVVSNLARQIVTANRRSSLSLAKVATLAKQDVMLQSAWLPGIGWVEFGLFKAEDFDLLARTYRQGAAALVRYAEWCEINAAAMREQDVEEFRQIQGALPALPAAEAA